MISRRECFLAIGGLVATALGAQAAPTSPTSPAPAFPEASWADVPPVVFYVPPPEKWSPAELAAFERQWAELMERAKRGQHGQVR